MVIVLPNSISKSLDIQALHVFVILLIIFSVVLLLHLLVLLLGLHLRCLIVVHLIVHILGAHLTVWYGVLFVELIQKLHEYLIVIVETFCLDFLSPAFIVSLHVVEDCVYKDSNVWVLIREELQNDGNHLSLI
jgi:hypothetical protein